MTPHLRGILALLLVTLVWGTTFPAMKALTAHVSPAWIVFTRFALAALVLAPFLLRATRGDLRAGFLLGLLLFCCFVFQVEGLALTSSNRNAFICGLNVLIVPLLGVAAGKLPERRIVFALALAVAGLAALCWDSGPWRFGDTLALGAALCFGVYVKMMERYTRRAGSLLAITATQIGTVAVCAGIWVLATESTQGMLPVLAGEWPSIVYLGLVATAAIISLQTWGQSHSSANEAAVVYAFEPAAAAFFAFFWLGETMTARGWIGAALLISGMIVSQWNSVPRHAAALAPE
ncbi:DMT family transporter [Massilia sp. PAMC28688]|uniref:DMT family transporter n=1 Tax=Massilia sp. PAMC28688 TaxID=2861283 RepID=UPI001C626227|nr:DMT family transporter [Massilia sp. PAMC28688]QYF95506.1 DMT family transporter [Massilia sp. PAMC28688]